MPSQTPTANAINTATTPYIGVHFPVQGRKTSQENRRRNRLSASLISTEKTNILRPNRTSVLNTSRFQSAINCRNSTMVTLQHSVRSCLV